MFFTILAFGTSIGFLGLAYIYNFHRRTFEDLVISFSWNLICFKTSLEEFSDKHFNTSFHTTVKDYKDSGGKFMIIGSDFDTTTITVPCENNLRKIFPTIKKGFEQYNEDEMLIFYSYHDSMVRVRENTNIDELLEIERVENPFFNVAVTITSYENKEPITISETIKPFYIKNNKLFDNLFINWFLRVYHNIFLEENDKYTVEVINSNFEVLGFNSDNAVTNNIVL